jgi:hypothetical protein
MIEVVRPGSAFTGRRRSCGAGRGLGRRKLHGARRA